MPYNHWFVSRQKRKLTTILPALIAYSDICVGRVWNRELQLEYEEALGNREITDHGALRSRRTGQGGGGTRTLFKQMKDLGLVFLEDDNRKCRLTLIGDEIINGSMSFVEAMRIQLQRYQYPSATSWSGSGSINHFFRVHPFQFIFRLLRDPRLENTLFMDEMAGIVIHKAVSDSDAVFEAVVSSILSHRTNGTGEYIEDTASRTFTNIANTFFNYIEMTQFVDRGNSALCIRAGKEDAVNSFIQERAPFISNPDVTENYLRTYGKGRLSKDTRNFDRDNVLSQKQRNEARIRHEYVLLSIRTPITGITSDIVTSISNNTGIDERTVERYLIKNYSHGNIEDFFLAYKESAHLGRDGARDFEVATCEVFNKIFKMRAKHVGPIGNTPDVLVESDDYGYCGIIDNKAYRNGYSISGDHKRVMEDVYIPNYSQYGETNYPLAFFAYIAETFGNNINSQLSTICTDSNVNGSAMPVDLFIDFAQDYAEKGYDHQDVRRVFSVNREVTLEDISRRPVVSIIDDIQSDTLSAVAER